MRKKSLGSSITPDSSTVDQDIAVKKGSGKHPPSGSILFRDNKKGPGFYENR
jgi:hypothetical protein